MQKKKEENEKNKSSLLQKIGLWKRRLSLQELGESSRRPKPGRLENPMIF